MIPQSPAEYPADLVAHYVNGFIVVVLGFTGYLLRAVWNDLKERVADHETRIGDLEVINGVRPERRHHPRPSAGVD